MSGFLSGFTKTLQDLGLAEKDDGTVEHVPEEERPAPPQPVAAAPPVYQHVTTPSVAGVVDNAVLGKLMGEVNQDAPPDYLKFQETLSKLAAVPGMTTQARYQAAVISTGMTKMSVAAAEGVLLRRLAIEEGEYQQMLDSARKEKVGAKQNEVAQLNATMESNRQKIAALEDENRKHVVAVAKLEGEIAANSVHLDQAESTFKATAQHAKNQITALRQEAEQYLPE